MVGRLAFAVHLLRMGLVAVALAGCVGAGDGPSLQTRALAVADLPLVVAPPLVGDVLVYSDGRIERVQAVDEFRYWLTRSPTYRIERSRNPVVPRLSSQARAVDRHFQLENPGQLQRLWPTGTASSTVFVAKHVLVDRMTGVRSSAVFRFSCAAEAHETVELTAGQFEAVRVGCDIDRRTLGAFWSKFGRKVVWFAPTVGYPVKVETRPLNAPPEVEELLAVVREQIPGGPEKGAQERAVANVLASTPSGETILTWQGEESAMWVRPVSTVAVADTFCRRYVVETRLRGVVYETPGMACRQPDGRWETPLPGADNLT